MVERRRMPEAAVAALSSPKLVIVVIALSSFIVTFDITAVIVAMPAVKSELGLDVSGFAWVMDSYSLAFTVLLMAAGVLADRYGRRLILLLGTATFTFASLLCGLAWSAGPLLTGRVIQGIAAAFVICGGLALISHLYPDKVERVKAFALAGTISGAAMALGPAGGGVLTTLFGWRWVFLVNIPICIIVGLAILRMVEESSDPQKRRIDVLGVVTLTLFLAVLTWTLLHGGEFDGFHVPAWATVVAPAAALVLFVATQMFQAEPMFGLSLFRSRAFVGMCSIPIALSLGYWALLVYIPLFMQSALGQKLETVSVLMLAVTLPMVCLPMLGGRIALAMGQVPFFAAGLTVLAAGCFVIACGAHAHDLWLAVIGMVLAGSGTAVVNPQVSAAIVAIAPKDRAGTASAIATVLRQGGFAIGIALLGAALRWSNGARTDTGAGSDFTWLFAVAGGGALVGAVTTLVLIRPERSNGST
jgi:EmrB/QacA subfamily drug resistance transporter